MPEWLSQLISSGVLLILIGFIWREHAQRDDERIKDLWDALGRDSKSGVRGISHDAHSTSKWNDSMLKELQRRVEKLEERKRNE